MKRNRKYLSALLALTLLFQLSALPALAEEGEEVTTYAATEALGGVTSTKDMYTIYKTPSAAVTETTTFDYKGSPKTGTGDYVIAENAEGNLVVTMNLFGAAGKAAADRYNAAQPTPDTFFSMPGDHYTFDLSFVNNSGHTYTYKAGSLTVAPGQYADGSDAYGFDGQNLMSGRKAAPSKKIVSAADYLQMDNQQRVDCLLNYVNTTFGTAHTDLSQLSATEMRSIAGHQEIHEYDNTMSEFAYNTLYNYLVGVSFTPNVTLDAAKGGDAADTVVYSVGNYMRGTAATKAAGEDVFAAAFGEMKSGTTVDMKGVQIAINGPMTGNLWAGYDFTGYIAFELEQVITTGDLTATKVDAKDGAPILNNTADFQLYRQVDGTNSYYTGTENALWSGDKAEAATLTTSAEAGSVTVAGLEAGNYFLLETRAPAGYTLSTDPVAVTVVVGETAQVTVANTAVVVPDPGPDPVPDPVPDPDPAPPSTEIPDTEVPLDPAPPVVIPDPEVPLIPAPEEEITDSEVPLAPTPEEETIVEEEVPLGDLPQTGTTWTSNGAYSVAAVLMLMVAAACTLLGWRKKVN